MLLTRFTLRSQNPHEILTIPYLSFLAALADCADCAIGAYPWDRIFTPRLLGGSCTCPNHDCVRRERSLIAGPLLCARSVGAGAARLAQAPVGTAMLPRQTRSDCSSLSRNICMDIVGMGQVHVRERLARSRGPQTIGRCSAHRVIAYCDGCETMNNYS